jgi:hypothetical protein
MENAGRGQTKAARTTQTDRPWTFLSYTVKVTRKYVVELVTVA